MDKIAQIKMLTQELLQYCHEYYDLDKPTISDKEYDKKFDELFKLENEAQFWLANSPTHKVQGTILEGLQKVTHSKPMLSAAKTKDINEIQKFIESQKPDFRNFYCSYKLDGLTLVVRYSNGHFVQAITRGTGLVGEDVTEQAKMISNLPMIIPYDSDLELRGECVISWGQFKKVNDSLEEPYSHPRNLAAGTIRNFDTNIVRDRKLSYIVFEGVTDFFDVDGLCDSKEIELRWLKQIGFDVVDFCVGSVEDCIEAMQPEYYEYPVDGLIFEIDNKPYSKSLPSTGHHEGCRMAFKWADSTYETVLRDVEWNTTRTGIISPVAVFDEVDLDGALTTRATLHNVSIIKQLELGVGDTITVYRSNMVIPKIDDNLTRSNTLEIPNQCPCCGHDAVVKNTVDSQVLTCTNPDCTAKTIAKFEHFVSRNCMNIEGLSSATIELLISNGFISDFRSIYALSTHMNELAQLPGMGAKSVQKLMDSIEKSRSVKLENFICALGIPNIGLSASKTISKYCDGDWDKFYLLVEQTRDWIFLDDFGKVMSDSLNTYLDDNFVDMDFLSMEMKFIVPEKNIDNSLDGLKFCITGSFSRSRDDYKKALEARGAKFVSSVSKNLDVLFAGDKAGSKLTKAQSLGIKVADENELIKLIGE